MRHKREYIDISYKRQRLLFAAMFFSLVMILALRATRKIPEVKLYQPEPKLTGPTVQTISTVSSYRAPRLIIFDDSLYSEESGVVFDGSDGMWESTTLVTFLNGRRMSDSLIETRVLQEAKSQEIRVGIKAHPKYIMPLSDYVFTSGVGPRWGTHHDGVDLAVPQGTEILCTADGVVSQSGWYGGYGICVTVEHGDGIASRYAHMSSASVSVGETVSQGDIIGYSGNTGHSTGPHLHFEIREDNVPQNPFSYMEE